MPICKFLFAGLDLPQSWHSGTVNLTLPVSDRTSDQTELLRDADFKDAHLPHLARRRSRTPNKQTILLEAPPHIRQMWLSTSLCAIHGGYDMLPQILSLHLWNKGPFRIPAGLLWDSCKTIRARLQDFHGTSAELFWHFWWNKVISLAHVNILSQVFIFA